MNLNKTRARFELGCYRSIDLLARIAAAIVGLVLSCRYFAFSLSFTLLFYLPSLRHGSVDAGMLYGGDVLGFYWPSLVKVHQLISSLNFTALDFSSFNGSADFFLTPNFFGVHPLFIGYSLLASPLKTSVRDIGHVLVAVAAIHSFIACYFSLKLLVRFFGFNFGMACFAATVFAFSVLMVHSLGEPQFIFCAAMLPWAAYAALSFQFRPSLARLLLASMPVLMAYLGGYIPMGVATLALSAAIVAARLLVLEYTISQLAVRIRGFHIALVPFVCGTLVASPYLYSVYTFLKQSPSSTTASLFYSAHQLSEAPSSLLRVISFHLTVPGAFYEFTATWGILAVTISLLALLSARTFNALTVTDTLIFKSAAVAYFATMLAVYGSFSVLSDIVYYYIPQVGSMHIYQRFLVPGNLLLGAMVAIMLKSLVEAPSGVALRVALVVLSAMTVGTAYIVGNNSALTTALGVNNYIVLELFLSCLFVLAMLFPGRRFVYAVAVVLFVLPVLDRMYDLSMGGNTRAEQQRRQVVALDDAARAGFVTYLKRYANKDIIKYVDTTPMWSPEGVETFPKQFPYLTLNEVNLSSYHGFNFYLSTRADYMQRMPVKGVNELYPDWDYVANTGADFLIAREVELRSGRLAQLIPKVDESAIYRLPNDIVVVPLKAFVHEREANSGASSFDNGYLRISESRAGEQPPLNIALHKAARQSGIFGTAEASRAVDGVVDGEFNHGSVTHTNNDRNAWFEIDLGVDEDVARVKIWNRTDCCGERLSNYWLFISEQPFAKDDTVDQLRTRKGVWSRIGSTPNPVSVIRTPNVRGRYVRVQLAGNLDNPGVLSLAEVEVFRADSAPAADSKVESPAVLTGTKFTTNRANRLRLDFETSKPMLVEYLLWSNPRLRFFLNGSRVTPEFRNGTAGIEVPAGRNTIEIVYRHWPLTVFWIVYGVFTVAWLLALVFLAFERPRPRPSDPAGFGEVVA